jgi:Polyphosphate kinase 2 (PPK2)
MIFDRSWYNRAGVERVMGFCTEEQAKQFLQMIPGVEKAIVDGLTRRRSRLFGSAPAPFPSSPTRCAVALSVVVSTRFIARRF